MNYFYPLLTITLLVVTLYSHNIFAEKPAHQHLTISQLEAADVAATKEMIIDVAYEKLGVRWSSRQELAQWCQKTGELNDVDNFATIYGPEHGGLFLVLKDDNTVVGSLGIRRLAADACELKRGWILKQYRSSGWGTKMMQQLLSFAVEHGYVFMRSEIDEPEDQQESISFHKKFGFYEIPAYKENTRGKLFLEKRLIPE